MEVFGAKVRDVRVQRMTEAKDTKPLSLEWAERRLERLEARIRAGSPAIAGDAVRREPLSDYIHRLNRRPDRRVDAAIASADFPVREIDGRKESVGPVNEVQLNYMFNQGKPWTIYAQMSNTGTPETNEWRERFGFVHNQLTGRDDTLQLDYITAGFDSSHSVLGSYDTPLDDAGLWRAKVNAGWSTYDATQVAGSQDFTGEGLDLGAELSRNVAQWGPTFLDVFAGVRYSSQDVDNETLEEEGRGRFLVPALGAVLARATDRSSLDAFVRLETNVHSEQASDDPVEADEIYDRLGRISADRYWWAAKGSIDYSRFLDAASVDAPARNAHQVAASGRFQYAFDDARLVPTEQAIMGGFMSVRGYDESIVAGDSSISGSLEYRLHIPQLLGNGGRPAADGGVPKPDAPGRSSSFRWVPDDAGLADWNLLARVFLDGAYVSSNNSSSTGTDSFEFDSTLLSTGLGLELSIKRNFSARVDWGMVLSDVKGGGGNLAELGDNRFHFLFTLMY
jgi:hemolysin activation/secretion protein